LRCLRRGARAQGVSPGIAQAKHFLSEEGVKPDENSNSAQHWYFHPTEKAEPHRLGSQSHAPNLCALLGFLLFFVPRPHRPLFGVAIFHAIVLIALAYGPDAFVIERDNARRFLQFFRELV
jgi:hypothetical protein